MLTATPRHQRETHGRAGLPVAAVNRVPLSAAHDKAQSGGSSAPVGVRIPAFSARCITQFLPCQTGRRFGVGLFSRSGITSRAAFNTIADQLPRKLSDPLRFHNLERLSYVSGSMSNPRIGKVVNVQQVVGEIGSV